MARMQTKGNCGAGYGGDGWIGSACAGPMLRAISAVVAAAGSARCELEMIGC